MFGNSAVPDEDSFLVDITNLHKPRVVMAFFENVYQKSQASKSAWFRIARLYKLF